MKNESHCFCISTSSDKAPIDPTILIADVVINDIVDLYNVSKAKTNKLVIDVQLSKIKRVL